MALLVMAGTVAVFAALFLLLADSVRQSEFVVRIDHNALDFVVHHRVGWLSHTARVVTVLGNGWMVAVVIVGSATTLMLRHRRIDAVFICASSTGSGIAVAITKHLAPIVHGNC